jgi:hypothetical protein
MGRGTGTTPGWRTRALLGTTLGTGATSGTTLGRGTGHGSLGRHGAEDSGRHSDE